MPNKLSYEYVKKQFEEKKWKLISTNYINSVTKLEVICNNGHNIKKNYKDFKKGKGCILCLKSKPKKQRNKITVNNYNYDSIKDVFDKKNWKLLTIKKQFKYNENVEVICNKGHKTNKRIGHFLNGYGCLYCNKKQKYTFEYIKLEIEKAGWKLINTEYKNSNQKLVVVCPNGHKNLKKFYERYSKCIKCINYNYDFIKSEFENINWTLLSKEYKNNREKMDSLCPFGHKVLKTYNSIRLKKQCIKCKIFKNEEKCRNIFEQYFCTEFVKSKPEWLNGLELDGYNKSLKLAFEYNGNQHYKFYPNYFHNGGIKEFFSQICRDKIKKYLCKQNKIKLVIINKNNINFIEKKILPKIKY